MSSLAICSTVWVDSQPCALHRRVEQAHQRRARLARAGEVEEVGGQFGPAFGAVLRQLVAAHALVERVDEGLGLGVARLGQALAHRGEDRFERDGVVLGGARRLWPCGRRSCDAWLWPARALGGGLGCSVAFDAHGNGSPMERGPRYSRGPGGYGSVRTIRGRDWRDAAGGWRRAPGPRRVRRPGLAEVGLLAATAVDRTGGGA